MSEYPNSVGVNSDAYSCCMVRRCMQQIRSGRSQACIPLMGCIALWAMSGCITVEPGFDSPAPSKRLDAIVDASTLEDDESLVKLVEKLRSFDPAERMFAIRSLEIRTGKTMGYDHASPDWERIEAFGRWIEYLDEQGIDTVGLANDETEATEATESAEHSDE